MTSWLLEASSSCSLCCSCLPMSAVLAAGRVASVGAQSPVSGGVYPCLALRPCSVEVARTINQSAAKNHQQPGHAPRAVRHQFGQQSGGKNTQSERSWSGRCDFRRSPGHDCRNTNLSHVSMAEQLVMCGEVNHTMREVERFVSW